MNVYEQCPKVTGGRFVLRLVSEEDCEDLLKVYSDPAAVPLFNSDNCNGDDFYYRTFQRMLEGIRMWLWSYEHGWFVRWSILDRAAGRAVGTVELFRQDETADHPDRGVLRLDLGSDYEREEVISQLLSMLLPAAFDWFGVQQIITKAIPAAGQRIAALTAAGFTPAPAPLVGHDGTRYGDYWVCIL